MSNVVCALNGISYVDSIFFIVCAVIIALIIAVYFLIPVFNKKLYKEQRDNLRKRETAFNSNLKKSAEPEKENTAEGEEKEGNVSADE